MKVAILGTGPSAAYVHQACKDLDVESKVYSNLPPRTALGGIFYLHEIPMSIRAEAQPIELYGLGIKELYQKREWGCKPLEKWHCSFPESGEDVLGYDPQIISEFWENVDFKPVLSLTTLDIGHLAKEYNWVFQTFPETDHRIKYQKQWLRQYRVRTFYRPGEHNFIVYNGTTSNSWLRAGSLFGWVTEEAPMEVEPQPMEIIKSRITPGARPQKSTIAKNVILTGRFATWNKKELASDSYSRASGIVNRNSTKK